MISYFKNKMIQYLPENLPLNEQTKNALLSLSSLYQGYYYLLEFFQLSTLLQPPTQENYKKL